MSLSRRTFICFVAATIAAGILRARPARAQVFGRRLEANLTPVIEATVQNTVNMLLMGVLIAIPILLLASLADLVEKTLKLTEAQKVRLGRLATTLLTDLQSQKFTLEGLQGGEVRDFLAKLEPTYLSRLEAILTREQLTRWQQVLLQFQGARGILSPAAGKELGLTAEQLAKVQELIATFDKSAPANRGGWISTLKLLGERSEVDRQAKAALTKAQIEKLEALQGESVELFTAGRLLGIAQELSRQLEKK